MMDTLNLLAYIIDDNKGVLGEVAVLKAKGYHPQLSDDEIKKEFEEMVKKFSKEIKPVLFNFWGYVTRISCDTKIDLASFEYIRAYKSTLL